MVRFTTSLMAVWCALTFWESSGLEVIRQECRPQQPTVLTLDQSDEPLITCSNNGTVATLSCRVDFHCAEHLIVGLIWAGYFAPKNNYRTDARIETETGSTTTASHYQWYSLETEQRYSSKTHKLAGAGHVLEAVLEVTSVSEEDYGRRFKCVVVTEYNYEGTGDTRPDIQGSVCANAHMTQGHQQIAEHNSAGTVTHIGGVLLAVLLST
ncbi:uncharacterized protein LOC110449048 isoform X2 [Mizuhopecten yessoensis]|uniref:Ig-like domain-containing protein n=2 Tax=Mizuhopecten yessoensis TaxID=6573 RepID=A0A210QS13_MIZYE|nr:uncharacterized protein LOC110449048 isoform X2 [Mizuhopecten yessoensis]OWF51523.1 hypothetical protein KP79_PYT20530 [Mizuhopecten yessoensis]